MSSVEGKYTISPSISAVVQLFGEYANNYKIFRDKTSRPPQSLLSYLAADFTGCYLRISMTDPTALSLITEKKHTLHIAVDAAQNFWLAFNQILGQCATSDTISGYEIKLPISVLGHHFITLIENVNDIGKLTEYFANPSKFVCAEIVLDVPVSGLPECYKSHQLRVAKCPMENGAASTNTIFPTSKPHTLMPTTWHALPEECQASISYQLVINLQKQNLKQQINGINTLPVHNLYPAMNTSRKRRARLHDCKCLKFGCEFVAATPEELKHHLKSSACSDYVDFYAANHQRLATDSQQIINDQLFKNTFPALCRKTTRVIQGAKSEELHNTYTCNSPLCEYTTHKVENILEHFRLLGCQYAPIIRKYYGTNHSLPTEADNRKWRMDNLIDKLNGDLTVSGNTKINMDTDPDIYRFDIKQFDLEWYSELITNLALGGMCINCCTNRQNVVSLGCCHLSICSKCLGSFRNPKCSECFLPLDEYMVITV